jgi:hypothetical protein
VLQQGKQGRQATGAGGWGARAPGKRERGAGGAASGCGRSTQGGRLTLSASFFLPTLPARHEEKRGFKGRDEYRVFALLLSLPFTLNLATKPLYLPIPSFREAEARQATDREERISPFP